MRTLFHVPSRPECGPDTIQPAPVWQPTQRQSELPEPAGTGNAQNQLSLPPIWATSPFTITPRPCPVPPTPSPAVNVYTWAVESYAGVAGLVLLWAVKVIVPFPWLITLRGTATELQSGAVRVVS
jgi:hypothetical protein